MKTPTLLRSLDWVLRHDDRMLCFVKYRNVAVNVKNEVFVVPVLECTDILCSTFLVHYKLQRGG